MQQPTLDDEEKKQLLEKTEQVTELWETNFYQPGERPWRKVQFNVLQQIRDSISYEEMRGAQLD